MENITAKINIPTAKAWASDIREFAGIIKKMLEQTYPSGTVVIGEDTKNNGLKRTGISVWEDGCNAAVVVYLEELYQQYLAGKPLLEICRIVMEINRSMERDRDMDISSFAEFSDARGRICYKLVNAGKNAALLQEVPHRHWQDLAVIYYILLSKGSENISSIMITNELMAYWHVEEDTLYEAAGENTPVLLESGIISMAGAARRRWQESQNREEQEFFLIAEFLGHRLPFYVVSNDCHVNGASVLLYDGVLEKFAGEMGGDFYILPTSIHETIWIPVLSGMKKGTLLKILHGVQEGYIVPEEFLSDNVYRYHAGEGCVRIVR